MNTKDILKSDFIQYETAKAAMFAVEQVINCSDV